MAAESRKISEYKTRVACSYEPWLSVGNSDVTLEIQGKYVEIPTISIFGGRKPVDVVLIVGDNFRAAAEAVEFLNNCNNRFGSYPEVVCMPGLCTPERVNYGNPEFWLKLILLSLGIPKDVVKKHSPDFGENPIEGLKFFLNDNKKMKKIAVFSSRGFSMNVAQELMFIFPKHKWSFYDNPFILEEDRIFESELIGPEGFAIDLMIANIVHSSQNWRTKRCPLVAGCHPEGLVLRKIAQRGYLLGIVDHEDVASLNMNGGDAFELLCERQKEFPWFKKPEKHVFKQVKRLIVQYQKR